MGALVSDLGEVGGSGFERVLAEARRVFREAGAGRAGAEGAQDEQAQQAQDGDAQDVAGRGEAAGGRVVVTVRAGGRVERVDLDPTALRLGTAELGVAIAAAVNAATDDLRARAGGPLALPPELAERLRALQDESVQQMQRFTQGIATAVERVTRTSGQPGRA
jgi:DNA-binding protein YbaB